MVTSLYVHWHWYNYPCILRLLREHVYGSCLASETVKTLGSDKRQFYIFRKEKKLAHNSHSHTFDPLIAPSLLSFFQFFFFICCDVPSDSLYYSAGL